MAGPPEGLRVVELGWGRVDRPGYDALVAARMGQMAEPAGASRWP